MNERLRDALQLSNPSDLIRAVKDAVTDELYAVDPALKIERTEYFNHTYVPDLVLKWHEGQRDMYLRRTATSFEVADDIDRLGGRSPVFFGIEHRDQPDEEVEEVIDAAHQQPTTLITESDAIDEFVRPTSASATLFDAVGSAVVRGGRGFLRESEARSLRSASDEVLGSALGEANHDRMSAALERWERHLQQAYYTDLRRFLKFVWMLSGGDPLEFPDAEADEPEFIASDDLVRILRHLCSVETEVENEDFWRRVGDHVTLATFEELKEQAPHPNLHRLLQANAGRITAKWVDLKRWTHTAPGAFAWRVTDGFLALVNGIDVEMRFANSGDRLARTTETPGPSLTDLRERLGQRGLVSLTTESGEYIASVEARDATADPSAAFQRLLEALERSGRVSKAQVRLAATTASCDFVLRRVNLKAPLSIRRLAQEAATMFGIDLDDHEKLGAFLERGAYEEVELPDIEEPNDKRQASLFDE